MASEVPGYCRVVAVQKNKNTRWIRIQIRMRRRGHCVARSGECGRLVDEEDKFVRKPNLILTEAGSQLWIACEVSIALRGCH